MNYQLIIFQELLPEGKHIRQVIDKNRFNALLPDFIKEFYYDGTRFEITAKRTFFNQSEFIPITYLILDVKIYYPCTNQNSISQVSN